MHSASFWERLWSRVSDPKYTVTREMQMAERTVEGLSELPWWRQIGVICRLVSCRTDGPRSISDMTSDGHLGFVPSFTPSSNAAANIFVPASLCLCPSISGKEFSRCGTAGKRCGWIWSLLDSINDAKGPPLPQGSPRKVKSCPLCPLGSQRKSCPGQGLVRAESPQPSWNENLIADISSFIQSGNNTTCPLSLPLPSTAIFLPRNLGIDRRMLQANTTEFFFFF